ncbi:SdrD B-like domain-containing protein [Ruania alba]|uniref:SD-repeat containing protein B domain-containing protein n=1 Tax=Ruania alba TaxID=648782 RepID=A0A1H5M391_9MICO|nr:SdrD B-like domain-containing protein [Ruania alba]SEE83849.1 hypothetical protein SAMN04488554_3130 [Ruania alba]
MRARRSRRSRWGVASATGVLIGSLVSAAGLAGAATAATGDEITGSVWQDYDANGVFDSYEDGLGGIEIVGYDAGGTVAGPVVSTADGTYTLPVTSDAARWRVEAHLPEGPEWDQWRPSAVGGDGELTNGTTVQMVTVADGVGADGADFSFHVPSAYVENNPYVFLPEYRFGASDGPAADLTGGEAIRYDAMSSTSTTPVPTTVGVPFGDMGATNGSAWQRAAEPGGLGQLFTAAYVRRHAGLGPGGIGAIYRVVPDGDSIEAPTASAEVFVDLTAWGVDVGSDSAPGATTGDPVGLRPTVTAENPAYDWVRDAQAFERVGREGLGGLALSPDETQMFVVNLHNRSLVRITTGSPATEVQSVDEFDLGFEGDMRPFGVSSDPVTGAMYLTVTNTAESTQDAGDLIGHVYRFFPDDPTALELVLEVPLDFAREARNGQEVDWRPWIGTVDDLGLDTDGPTVGGRWPMPMLADAKILHGQMVLGVRDLWGDLVGSHTLLGPDPASEADNTVVTVVRSYGDVYLADDNDDGTFTLENDGVVGGVSGAGAANELLGPGGYKYFDDSWAQDGGGWSDTGLALGSIVTIPSRDDGVLTTAIHAANGSNQVGVRRLFQDTGANFQPRGALVIQNESPHDPSPTPSVTSKGNGLGSVSIAASAAPIEIGNYLWYDADNDGVQDPDEAPVEGATVNLYEVTGDGTRTLVSSALTNEWGEYYFSSFDEGYQLMTNTDYVVGVDNPDDYAAGGPLENWYPTVPDVGAAVDPDRNDSDGLVEESDGGSFPFAAITTDGPGENDHTIDFGYALIDYEFDKRIVSGPTQSSDDDGTWVIEYDLVAENLGGIDGAYGLSDDLTGYGEGIVVARTEVVSGPDGAALNPDWDGVDDMRVITEDMPIAAGSTIENESEHVYLLRVTVALATDPETGDAVLDPSQFGCAPDQGGDDTAGLFNAAAMDPVNSDQLSDDECADLPVVTLDKTVTAEPHPVDPVNNPGEYEVTYGLTVTNETETATSYALADRLRFGAGVTVVAGSVVAENTAPGDVAVNPAYDGGSEPVIATDVPIAGGQVDTYTVTVRYAVDLPGEAIDSDPSSCGAIGSDDLTTGLFNEAVTSFNGYRDYGDACREVGEVTHDKVLVSAEPAGEGQWEIVYQIEVSNNGVEQVGYDLDDELHFGAGIEVTDAAITGSPEDVALTDPAWDGSAYTRVVTGATMPGTDDEWYAPHVYELTVLADVPLTFADPVDGVDPATCGDGAVDHADPQARAFLNVSHLIDEAGAVEGDDACAAPPEFAIDKTTDSASPALQGDGSWLVTYGIEVTNTGGLSGEYDLADLLRFSDSIEVLETGVTVAPEGVEVNDSWIGSEDELGGSLIAADVPLDAGVVHSYEVQVFVTIDDPSDPAAVTEALTCPELGSDEVGGLNNQAGIGHNDLVADDVACAEPAVIELDKTIADGPDLDADGAYTITYEIEVTNAGVNDTAYDLADELAFGEGIVVTGSEVTAAPEGVEPSQTWSGMGAGQDLVIVTGVPIVAGGVHVYEVTVTGTIAEETLGTAAMGCPPAGTTTDGGGFLNVATVTGAGIVLDDDACASPPPELPSTGADGLTLLALLGG